MNAPPGYVEADKTRRTTGTSRSRSVATRARWPACTVCATQAWNEPNLSVYLTPQYRGGSAVGADHYRRMLNAFFSAVRGVGGDHRIVTGSTAPYGDLPGAWCLPSGGLLVEGVVGGWPPPGGRPDKPSGGPLRSAVNPNDASTPTCESSPERCGPPNGTTRQARRAAIPSGRSRALVGH